MRLRLLILLAFSLCLGLSVTLIAGGSIAISRLESLTVGAATSLMLLVISSWLCNAFRVFLLLKKESKILSFRKTLTLILACDFSVKSTPAGIGGPVTAIAFLNQESVKPTITISAFSLLFGLDIILVLTLSFLLYLIGLYEWMRAGLAFQIFILTLSSSIILISLIKLPSYYRRVVNFFGSILQKTPRGRGLYYNLARKFIAVKAGWKSFAVLSHRTQILIISSSVCYWIIQFSLLYSCLRVLGAELDWAIVGTVQFLAMGAGRLIMLPSGSGGLEAVAIGLLSLWIAPDVAASGVLLWRTITLLPSLAAGGLVMFFLGISPKSAKTEFPVKP